MRGFAVIYLLLASLALSCSAKPKLISQSSVDIVGGMTTDIQRYPFMVGLAHKEKGNFEYLCGGSQIEPGVVLTAAHCFEGVNMKKNGYLVFNLQRIEDLEDSYKFAHSHDVVTAKITAFIKHEDYDYFDLSAPDLALVFYDTSKVPESTSQSLIVMADQKTDTALATEMATFIGHGAIDPEGYGFAEELQSASFPRIDLKACRSYKEEGYSDLNDEFLCYGYPDKGEIDFCFGDSGGPLFHEDAVSGPILLGLANWGSDPCAQPDEPGVYTRVSAHWHWIAKKIALQQSR